MGILGAGDTDVAKVQRVAVPVLAVTDGTDGTGIASGAGGSFVTGVSSSVLVEGKPVVWSPFAGFQTQAIEDGCDDTFFGGAAGPGKTDVLIVKMMRAAAHPSCRGLFLRTSYTDLREVMDRMHELYPLAGGVWHPSAKRWEFTANGGGIVELGYGKNLGQVARYLGRQFTTVAFDEIGMLGDETPWQLLLSRLRSKDRTVPLRAWSSANPGGAGHSWLKGRYVEPWRRSGGKPWRDRATGLVRNFVPGKADKDNPALSPDYWKRLKDLPPALQKAMREGDWDAGLGLFYPELQGGNAPIVPRGTLPWVAGALPAWWDYWGAYDWGFRHPSVMVWLARDETNRILVLDALYQHRINDADQAEAIAKRAFEEGVPLPKECLQRVYAGSDAFFVRQAHAAVPDTVQDVFQRVGVGLERANTERVTGSATVRRPLLSGGIVFVDTPGCRRLIAELKSLVPDPSNPEAPLKVDANADTGHGGDDGPDALRYGLATPAYQPYVPVKFEGQTNLAVGADEDYDRIMRGIAAYQSDNASGNGGLSGAAWNGSVRGLGGDDGPDTMSEGASR